MFAVVLSYMAFTMLMYVPSMPIFWRVLIINRCWILSKDFSASIEIMIWFLSFNLLIWCILLIDLHILKNPSVQFSRSVMSNSLQPHELEQASPPCPSPTPRVYSNSCPLSQWCHPAISSSVVPFSSCPQSLPASGSFPLSQLFTWGGQSTAVSALASFLPKHPGLISFRMDWLDLLAVQGTLKSLLQHHSSKASILRPPAFFTVQLSHPYMTTGKTIAWTRRTLVFAFEYAIWVGHNFPSKE